MCEQQTIDRRQWTTKIYCQTTYEQQTTDHEQQTPFSHCFVNNVGKRGSNRWRWGLSWRLGGGGGPRGHPTGFLFSLNVPGGGFPPPPPPLELHTEYENFSFRPVTYRGGRSANKFQRSQLRKFGDLNLQNFWQMWQFPDWLFADQYFFAICGFAICGPNYFLRTQNLCKSENTKFFFLQM